MYTVTLDDTIIHNPSRNDFSRMILNGVITKKVNCADSFTFTVYPSNIGYDDIELLNSKIKVFKDGTCIFSGRPLKEETDFYNGKTVLCESDLAILNDSVMRPYKFNGSIEEYLRLLINSHNAGTTSDKQITIGSVTVTDPNNYIVRSCSDYSVTLSELMDKTVGYLGGYLRMIPGTMTLDYLQDSTSGTNQTLEIGKNILDFSREISSESLATMLIPLGAADDETGERLTIKEVNGNLDYIEDAEAVAERGRIYTTMVWDDVTNATNLLNKARAALADLKRMVPRIEMTAVDLKEAGLDVDALDFFEYVTVVDSVHGVSGQYLITERKYNLSAPDKDIVTFGGADQTISAQTAKAQATADQISSTIINTAISIIEKQTGLIKAGSGGHVVITVNEDGYPNEIFFMDTDSVETARQILRINMNGIGFSTTGIDGPYTNAWTIDGSLNASFISTGILSDGGADPNFYLNLNTGELRIKQLTTIAESIENLEVGSENLIRNSEDWNYPDYYFIGQAIYDTEERVYFNTGNALAYRIGGYQANNLDSITVSFDSGEHTVTDQDTLESIKEYFTVTANYDDGTSAVVHFFTISGDLVAGSSEITVRYGGFESIGLITVAHAA